MWGITFKKYCFYHRINISKLNRSNIAIKEDSTFQLDTFSIAYVIAIGKTMGITETILLKKYDWVLISFFF